MLKKDYAGRLCFQTLFSRNHSNPRAVGTSWLLKRHFFDFFEKNFAHRKLIKNWTSITPSPQTESQKSDPWVPKARFWNNFGCFLASLFSINFPDRLNLVICNTYNAKTSFLPFQPRILASNIDQQIMFF